MKFKEGDEIFIGGDKIKKLKVFGLSHPWGNKSLPEFYMVGEGDKFLPGFTGTWVSVEELESIAELVNG